MNLIYVIFIVIIVFSLITGLIVTIVENKEKKLYKEMNSDNNEEEIEELELTRNDIQLSQDSINNNIVFDSPVIQDNNGFSTNNVAPIIPNNDIEELDIQSSDDDQSIIQNNLTRDTINSTLRVDSKEKLENTIELKIKNNNKKYYDIPQLSPYSIVDDDVIWWKELLI